MGKHLKWLVLLIGASIYLTGCSSKAPVSKTVDPPKLDQVSLQLQWVTQTQFAGYYVASEKGWYRDEGIELVIKPGGPDIVPVDVVGSGAAEFGTTLLADLTVAIHAGKPVISIGQIQQRNGLILVSRKSSEIRHPKDFSQKRVGVWLGSWEVQFNALLAREKVDPHQVKLISQGWSMNPFIKGELDVASAMVYNEYQAILAAGIPPDQLNIIDYSDFDLAFPGDVLFTSKQLVDSNPDLCLRMLRASLRGWEHALAHPQEAVEIVLKHDQSRIQKKDHQQAMMAEITSLVQGADQGIGDLDETTLNRMVRLLRQYGIINSSLNPSDIFNRQFVDQIQNS